MDFALELNGPLKTVSLSPPPDFVPTVNHHEVDDYSSIPDVYSVNANVFRDKDISVGWRVVKSGHAIELSALELVASRLPVNGPRVLLEVPAAIASQCVSLASTGHELVLDLVLVSGHLLTTVIPFNWLTKETISEAEMRRAALDLTIFSDFATLGVPFPRIITAVSSQTLLLAFFDGKLARLDRLTPSDQPKLSVLANDFVKPEASGFSRFFRSTSDKVPGHPNLSVNAISSMLVVGDNVVSYTVNNTLQVWSLYTNSCTQSLPTANASNHWRVRPTTYLTHRDSLVSVLGLHHIKLYDIQNDRLVQRSEAEFDIPESLKPWFVLGLDILDHQSLLVAFKLDTCAQIYTVSFRGVWTKVGGYDNSYLLGLPIDSSFSEIKRRVLQTNPAVLKLALSQLKALFSSFNPDSTVQTLNFAMESHLNELSSEENSNDQSRWLKLDTLCREYEAKGRELLALTPMMTTSQATFMWGVCASGFRIRCIDHQTYEQASLAEETIGIADELLCSVTPAALAKVSHKMLDSGLLMDRIENVCSLLRRYINQKKLSDFGRSYADRLGAVLTKYCQVYGPQPATNSNFSASTAALSPLGTDCVNMLVFDYASHYAANFRKLLAVAAIGFVEGWLVDENESELLRSLVEILRRFSFIEQVGFKNLNLDVANVPLEDFGEDLARHLTYACDPSQILTKLLPPLDIGLALDKPADSLSPSTAALIERALVICERTPEFILLQGLTYIAGDRHNEGTELIQRVSLSHPWPSTLKNPPPSLSDWFYRLAKYALALGAENSAFKLIQLGESLAEGPKNDDLLALLFQLAIQRRDISVAYLALTRRFTTFRESNSEKALASAWIRDLITAAAQIGAEEARQLVVSYPFVGFAQSLQDALLTAVSFSSIPAYKLRYAWFVERDDFVGAAQVIYQHIRHGSSLDLPRKSELFTVCLNALALAPKHSRWLHDGNEVVHFDDIKLQQDEVLTRIAQQI